MRWLTYAALVWVATGAGWLDRWHQARTGNRLYDEGKYEDAATAYNQGLVDEPDSPTLHFNLGAAQYKQSQYDAALKALRQVPMSDDTPDRTARAAYNAGNAAYKLGTMTEGSEPQKSLEQWAQALVFYRRALGVQPDHVDAKFNYEFVGKRIADLKQKLEEQKQQQEQQKDEQKDQQQDQQKDEQAPQDQQKQDQQPSDQQGEQKPEPSPSDQGEPKDEPKDEPKEQPSADQQPPQDQPKEEPPTPDQAGGGSPQDDGAPDGQAGESDSDIVEEKKDGEMSKKEAAAVLDGQRDEEVQPGDIVERMQGGRVGRPAKDW